jgi:hypothetical protein
MHRKEGENYPNAKGISCSELPLPPKAKFTFILRSVRRDIHTAKITYFGKYRRSPSDNFKKSTHWECSGNPKSDSSVARASSVIGGLIVMSSHPQSGSA